MNPTDYLVIVAVVISAVIGALRGFLREAVAFASWIIALFIAWHFSDLVEPHLGGLLAGSTVKPWAARVILVLLILAIGSGVGAVLGHFVRLSIFSGMDRFLGLVFGLLRGALLLGVFVMLGQVLQLDGERWWRRSLLVPYGEAVANGLRTMVGADQVHRRDSVTAATDGTRCRSSLGTGGKGGNTCVAS